MARRKDINNPFKMDIRDVERERQAAAKKANQRLVRLERRKASTGEKLSDIGIAQYAYEQIKQIRHIEGTKSGKLRFREGKVSDPASARLELFVLQSFLSEETSKAGKAARYVSKTEKTFLEKGIKVGSYKSFYNFLNSATFAALKESFSSDDIVELYNKASKKGGGSKTQAEISKIMAEFVKQSEESGKAMELKDLAGMLGVSVL